MTPPAATSTRRSTNGELVAELHGHTAAEGVTDHSDLGNAQDHQQIAHAVGERGHRAVCARLVGQSVPQQVGRDDRVVLGERRDDVVPGGGIVADTVDQQQSRPAAGDPECAPVAVHRPVLDTHAGVGDRMQGRGAGSFRRRDGGGLVGTGHGDSSVSVQPARRSGEVSRAAIARTPAATVGVH